jgi:hypothetical protein
MEPGPKYPVPMKSITRDDLPRNEHGGLVRRGLVQLFVVEAPNETTVWSTKRNSRTGPGREWLQP